MDMRWIGSNVQTFVNSIGSCVKIATINIVDLDSDRHIVY